MTTISELIITRLSHDLIGNVGAFANAMELLEDDDSEFMGDIVSMLKISSETLNARLKFFRTAFGLDGPHLEQNDLIIETTQDYLKSLNPNHPITLKAHLTNKSLNKPLMLATMCVADTIVRGGEISINTNTISVSTSSSLSQVKIEAMINILNGKKIENNVSLYAPLFYLLDVLQKTGRKLTIQHTDKLVFIID